MDPSSRALLGALLCGLLLRASPAAACSRLPPGHRHLFAAAPAGGAPLEMGACVGGTPAAPLPADSPPAELRRLRALPGGEAGRPPFSLLGYREDEAAGRLLGPDGRPVSDARADWLLTPVDTGRVALSALAWQTLQIGGYRLDEADCRLTHPEQGAITNLDIAQMELQVSRSNELSALETLQAGLRGLPPGSRVPPALIARLRSMETAQVRLPEGLRERLFGARAPRVSDIAGPAEAAYAVIAAYWDQQRDLESLTVAARPLGTDGSQPPRPASTMRAGERRLGELLARELQALYEGTEPGRELLRHFRRPDGSVVLPPILVVKLTQRADDPNQPGAVYNHEGREIVMNHWTVLQTLLAELPPAERAARGRELADAAALGRFLEANPEVRRRVVGQIDFLVLHEFVHYRQGDVSPIQDEGRRGNLPNALALSLEHEAHRQECRYYLSRVAADPSLIARGYGGNRQEYCPGVLADPGRLENYVTDLYTRTYAGSATLPEVRSLQAVRRDAAVAAMLRGSATMEERARAALQVAGIRNGDASIAQEEERIAAERRLYDQALAPLRAETAGVPDALIRLGKPFQALSFLAGAGWDGRVGEARATVLAAMSVLTARDARSTLEERLQAMNLVVALGPRVGAARADNSLNVAHSYDMDAYAAQLRREARGLPRAQARDLIQRAGEWETAARSWRAPLRASLQATAAR